MPLFCHLLCLPHCPHFVNVNHLLPTLKKKGKRGVQIFPFFLFVPLLNESRMMMGWGGSPGYSTTFTSTIAFVVINKMIHKEIKM